jgi:hypothetical protein
MTTPSQRLDAASAKYRRTYDRLFVASARANSAEESDAIDAKLRAANLAYEEAKAEVGRAFVGHSCRLDGKDATISGRQNDFATVSVLPNGPSYEFAWPTVARIMARDQHFES